MKHLTRVLPTLLRTLQCFCVLGLSFSPNWELLENRRGSDAKQSACRRPGSNPWVRKIPWRREWQPTPGFLSGEFHGLRSLAAYSPWGHKESDTTEQHTHTHTHTHTQRRHKWGLIRTQSQCSGNGEMNARTEKIHSTRRSCHSPGGPSSAQTLPLKKTFPDVH